jgi:hypothetical protein
MIKQVSSPTDHAQTILNATLKELANRLSPVCSYIALHQSHFSRACEKNDLHSLYMSRKVTDLSTDIEFTSAKGFLIHLNWKMGKDQYLSITYEPPQLIFRSKKEKKEAKLNQSSIKHLIPSSSNVLADTAPKIAPLIQVLGDFLDDKIRKAVNFLQSIHSLRPHYVKRVKSGLHFPVYFNGERKIIFLKWIIEHGSSKKVTLALDIESPNCIVAALICKDSEASEPIMMEYANIQYCKGIPGIVPTFVNHCEHIEKKFYHVIVQPFAENKDLKHVLDSKALTRSQSFQIATDLTYALLGLHDKGLIHSDLKPENVLITKEGRALLGDLAFVQNVEGSDYRIGGSVVYMTPEILTALQAKVYTKQTFISFGRDLFALGLILHELFLKKPSVWEEMVRKSSREEWVQLAQDFRTSDEVLKRPVNSMSIEFLIWNLLNPDPEKRMSAKRVHDILVTLAIQEKITFLLPHGHKTTGSPSHSEDPGCMSRSVSEN